MKNKMIIMIILAGLLNVQPAKAIVVGGCVLIGAAVSYYVSIGAVVAGGVVGRVLSSRNHSVEQQEQPKQQVPQAQSQATAFLSASELGRQLFDKAGYGYEHEVRALITAGALVNWRNQHETTPLMEACGAGKAANAFALLQAQAEVDAMDKHRETALIKAVHEGSLPCLQCLRNFGASLIVRYSAEPRPWKIDASTAVLEFLQQWRYDLRLSQVADLDSSSDDDNEPRSRYGRRRSRHAHGGYNDDGRSGSPERERDSRDRSLSPARQGSL